MKKLFAIFLVIAMLFSVSACARHEQGIVERAEAEDEQIEQEHGENLDEILNGFVGKDIGSLLTYVGEPTYVDHAPSCLGPGEDGEYHFNGFVVYTYRENDVETVEEIVWND